MKINTTKLVVGVLAVAGVASLVGSISGTVAWFQYNTRTVAEFKGTSAKCSEFLEVRTVKKGLPIKDAVTTKPESMVIGDKYLNTDDKKIHTATSTTAWDEGVTADTTRIYGTADKLYKYDSTNSAWVVDSDVYGEWKTSVSNTDILNATGREDNGLSPVTVPFANSVAHPESSSISGNIYGHPICGYALYDDVQSTEDAIEPHWNKANGSEYMSFDLQFRVLDIDGETVEDGNDPAMLAQDLFLTDLTIVKDSTASKNMDLSKAVRVHIANGTTNYMTLAQGAGNADLVTTATEGNLDLNLDKVLDNKGDEPGAHYTFNTTTTAEDYTLKYGSDKPVQKAYDVNYASSSIYPTNDGAGNLTNGTALGKTVANPKNTAFAATKYLTLSFTMWLEGWEKLPNTGSTLGEVGKDNTIWSAANVIGSKFNIGMSFGVTALK